MWKRNFIVPILWLLLLIFTANNFFFWDTIQLASKQAHFFFDNQFQKFFLPAEINSGHPPFYGLMLAVVWKMFGKSLIVSHGMNALFVLGLIYQAHVLGRFFLGKTKAFLFPLVLFCNPIFLGHSILVSPDNVLMFALIFAVNGIVLQKNWMTITGSFILVMISMRGMMVMGALLFFEFAYHFYEHKIFRYKLGLKYLPALLFISLFFGVHFIQNGWIGYHSDSPWSESFESVSVMDYLKNLVIIGWRLIDFGNIIVILSLVVLMWNKRDKIKHFHFFLSFFIVFGVIFILPLASYKYLTAHRYFMPLFFIVSISFIYWTQVVKWKTSIVALILVFLFLGNFWVYPRSISQGWDVSLAHLPFYSIVEKMNTYIAEEEINAEEVYTEFPLKSEAKYLYLDENDQTYKEGKIGVNRFIIYSNVINDFKDADYKVLKEDYLLIKEFEKLNIEVGLYEKR